MPTAWKIARGEECGSARREEWETASAAGGEWEIASGHYPSNRERTYLAQPLLWFPTKLFSALNAG